MRKIINIGLAAFMLFAIGACEEKKPQTGNASTSKPATEQPAETEKAVEAEKESEADSMAVFALSWPRMGVDEFGCMMEKTFGHRDERFNCSLKGYENKGDPCENTDEYYEGFAFPEHLVKKVHPQLSRISLNWEAGSLRSISFSFDGAFTNEQVLKIFGLSQEYTPADILYVSVYNGSLELIGFEHADAGHVDCGD